MKIPSKKKTRMPSDATAERQRKIQKQADNKDAAAKSAGSKKKKAAQASTRNKTENPLSRQHQSNPSLESELDPHPQFMAPGYSGCGCGSGKLAGKAAIITGCDSGVGRAVAVGKLSVLVNHAAFQEHAESLQDMTDEHFEETLRTNLFGNFQMVRAALPHLGSGDCIINTGSETGLFGTDKLLDYSMSKAGIQAFTKALALNLAKRGIRVNAVASGPGWTPLNPADQSAEEIQKFGQSSGMGRPAQAEELFPAYVLLAAPACSSDVTGATLPVMGGPHP